MKLYALRTKDTGEWVNLLPISDVFFTDEAPIIFPSPRYDDHQRVMMGAEACKDTGHPCEWVEVQVIEAKPVTEEVIAEINPFVNAVTNPVFAAGFRAACNYLGVGVESDHLPDAGNVMYVLDTIDSQREEAADNYVSVNGGNFRNHWDFKQGAKWAIEAIKLGVADHLPEAGKKVEPSGDSGELEAKVLNETIADKPFTYSLIIEAMHRYGRMAFKAARNLSLHNTLEFETFEDWTTKTQTK